MGIAKTEDGFGAVYLSPLPPPLPPVFANAGGGLLAVGAAVMSAGGMEGFLLPPPRTKKLTDIKFKPAVSPITNGLGIVVLGDVSHAAARLRIEEVIFSLS